MGSGHQDLLKGKLEGRGDGAAENGEAVLAVVFKPLLGEGHGDEAGAVHPQAIVVVVLKDESNVSHGDVAKQLTIRLYNGDTGDTELAHLLQRLKDRGGGEDADDLRAAKTRFGELQIKNRTNLCPLLIKNKGVI